MKKGAEKFADQQSGPERGLQIYLLLIAAAAERRTITYSGLADRMGLGGTGVLGPFLDYPFYWCEYHGLPPLTSIVVRAASGQPGHKFEDVDTAREDVYRFDWFSIQPPTAEALDAARKTLKDK